MITKLEDFKNFLESKINEGAGAGKDLKLNDLSITLNFKFENNKLIYTSNDISFESFNLMGYDDGLENIKPELLDIIGPVSIDLTDEELQMFLQSLEDNEIDMSKPIDVRFELSGYSEASTVISSGWIGTHYEPGDVVASFDDLGVANSNEYEIYAEDVLLDDLYNIDIDIKLPNLVATEEFKNMYEDTFYYTSDSETDEDGYDNDVRYDDLKVNYCI